MDERTRLYADFAGRFACDGLYGPAKPCDPLELDRAEAALGTYLPASYRQFLCNHGPLFVPGLWDAIVERQFSAHPLREFLNAHQLVTHTQLYWSGGMSRDFVGVAGDFMDNLFGFHRVAGIAPGRMICRSACSITTTLASIRWRRLSTRGSVGSWSMCSVLDHPRPAA